MKQMNLKKVRHIMYGCFAVFFLLVLLGAALKSIPVIILGVLVGIACIVFSVAKWRCPHCGAPLGRDGGKYCPHCGQHLVDLE